MFKEFFISFLKDKEEVNVLKELNGWDKWYEIESGSINGYVLGKYLEVLDEDINKPNVNLPVENTKPNDKMPESTDSFIKYIKDSGEQVVLGRYSDKVTVLGTAADVGLAITGLDAAQNLRDITYDLQHLKEGWSNVGNLVLDTV
ncbi:MAG: hypothetical protein ACRC7R_01865, partial [Sarcina sp.]